MWHILIKYQLWGKKNAKLVSVPSLRNVGKQKWLILIDQCSASKSAPIWKPSVKSSLPCWLVETTNVQKPTQQNWKHDMLSQYEALDTGNHATIGMLKKLVRTSKISQLQDITNISGNKKNHPASGPLTREFCCQQPSSLSAEEDPWNSTVSASAG